MDIEATGPAPGRPKAGPIPSGDRSAYAPDEVRSNADVISAYLGTGATDPAPGTPSSAPTPPDRALDAIDVGQH